MRLRTAVLLVLLAIATQPAAEIGAASRKACKAACVETIAECWAGGQKLRRCRKQSLRRCRREGVTACESPVSSTTVTSTTIETVTTTSGGTTTTLATDIRLVMTAHGGYSGASVSGTTCTNISGYLLEIENLGDYDLTLTDGWTYAHGCTAGPDVLRAVPAAYRDDFFDYVFPLATTDVGAARYCSSTLLVPAHDVVTCTLWTTEAAPGSPHDQIIRNSYQRSGCEPFLRWVGQLTVPVVGEPARCPIVE